MEPVALLLEAARTAAAERGQGREDRGELIDRLRAELGLEPAEVERAEIVVKRLEHRAEGHVALQLHGPAAKHEPATLVCPLRELRQQAGLADSWIARDLEPAAAAGRDALERALEQPQLLVAANELPALAFDARHRSARDRSYGSTAPAQAPGAPTRACDF